MTAAALALLIPLGVVGGVTPASAAPPQVPGCGGAGATAVPASAPRVVSVVGDSFSSGEGTGGYLPGAGSSSFWRHQSPYAPGALAWLYLETTNQPLVPTLAVDDNMMDTTWGANDKLNFLASSGAETKHLVLPQVDSDTGLARNGPQADGIRQDSNVVLYGFGGNDAHYGDILQTALTAYIKRAIQAVMSGKLLAPSWVNTQLTDVNAAIAREEANLYKVKQQVYGSLATTRASAPNALIVVSLYPVGVKQSGNPTIPFMGGTSLDAMYGYAQGSYCWPRTLPEPL